MRNPIAIALLVFAAGTVHAQPRVKTLAQFDLGYAKCEARFEHMKGHGDDAYLALWKINPDAQQYEALARQRKSKSYREERVKAHQQMAKPSPELDEKLDHQCRATWTELQRNTPPKARAASAPVSSPAKAAASAGKK